MRAVWAASTPRLVVGKVVVECERSLQCGQGGAVVPLAVVGDFALTGVSSWLRGVFAALPAGPGARWRCWAWAISPRNSATYRSSAT